MRKSKFWKKANKNPLPHLELVGKTLRNKEYVKGFVLLLPLIEGYIRFLLQAIGVLENKEDYIYESGNERVLLGNLIKILKGVKIDNKIFDRSILNKLKQINNLRRKILHQGLYYEDIKNIDIDAEEFCNVGLSVFYQMQSRYGIEFAERTRAMNKKASG